MTPTFFAFLPFFISAITGFRFFVIAYKENELFDMIASLFYFVFWSMWVVAYFVALEYFASMLVKTL